MMSHTKARWAIILLLVAVAVMAGCLRISNVDQPSEATEGSTIKIYLNLNCTINFTGYAGIGAKIPNDWVVVGVDVSGDLIGGPLTENATLEAWLEARWPSGADYYWWGAFGPNTTHFTNQTSTITLTVRVGESGDYYLDYVAVYNAFVGGGLGWLMSNGTYSAGHHIKVVGKTEPPVLRYYITPQQARPGEQVVFDASDSYDPDGNIIYIEWIFPDEVIPNSIAFKTFSEPGLYHVILRAVDDSGMESSESFDYEVVGIPPVANFTYEPYSPIVNQVVTFNASPSYDPDGTIVSYVWNFGDGSTGDGVVVSHTYASEGTYTVTLTVTDDDGLTNTTSMEIQVSSSSSSTSEYTFSDLITVLNLVLSKEYDVQYDLDGDGSINFGDLVAVLNLIIS
jgi:uncharacterized protein YceK